MSGKRFEATDVLPLFPSFVWKGDLAQAELQPLNAGILKALAEMGMDIEESTLYPLLRRLESQGLLVSEWREEEKRNKRFYRLSPVGEEILQQLLKEWESINGSLARILQEA